MSKTDDTLAKIIAELEAAGLGHLNPEVHHLAPRRFDVVMVSPKNLVQMSAITVRGSLLRVDCYNMVDAPGIGLVAMGGTRQYPTVAEALANVTF